MARGRPRAGGRAKKAKDPDAPPDIYQQMLDEADIATTSSRDAEGKAVKKRRVGGRIVVQKDPTPASDERDAQDAGKASSDEDEGPPSRASSILEPVLQMIDYDPEDSQEDEDDDIFEDVEIDSDDGGEDRARQDKTSGLETLNLVLGDQKQADQNSTRRRKAIASITDRKLIMRIHKWHVLCLLSHLSLRNHWCNDVQVQRLLRKVIPKKIREQLVDDENESQYTRDLKLREGLQAAMEVFKDRFHKTARGLSRAWWDAAGNDSKLPSFDDLDLLVSVHDFRRAATRLEGSRDLGAQLFCAMLRSCGLEVRLVHSLQVLPINGAVRPEPQEAPHFAQIMRYQDTRSGMADAPSPSSHGFSHMLAPEEDVSTQVGRAAGVRRRLAKLGGRSSLTSSPAARTSARASTTDHYASQPRPQSTQVKPRESSCPVYWAEVFSPAYQKWIPVDPLVTNSFSKPSAMCPALKDSQNVMAYVVGMEDDGTARDVTRRYSNIYNAKTRKFRVDAMAGSEGSKWWRRVLRLYRRSTAVTGAPEDRDIIEDAEFRRREAREGMPKNIEDFKGHPIYVLERHLRRNEVIHPKRQVGTTGGEKSATTKGKPVEVVYRRQDVHMVKSADAWYRLGREIKFGQQPLKRVPRRNAARASSVEDEEEDGGEDQGLYAFFQTELYRAPPVVLGRIPRNAYGNLDVYVPTMIPPGAVHILHEDTRYAAHLLKIDCADAVTGFEFKGRQGTAVVRGAVVAAEYKDAVIEILHGFEIERAEAAATELAKECLRLWRSFLTGLRIKARVDAYARDDESDESVENHSSDEEYTHETSEDENGGGFTHESETRIRSRPKSRIPMRGNVKGNFTVIEGPGLEVFQPEPEKSIQQQVHQKNETAAELGNAAAGGFLLDSDEDRSLFGDTEDPRDDGVGGGFLVEDADVETSSRDPASGLVDHQNGISAPATGLKKISSSQSDREPTAKSIVTETKTVARPHERILEDTATTEDPNIGNDRDLKREGNSPPSETSDRGSLLSEDPEDMDADPDWLG